MNLREAAQYMNSLINLERKNFELLHVSSLLNCRANQRLLLQALEAVCTTGIAGIGTVMAGKGYGRGFTGGSGYWHRHGR